MNKQDLEEMLRKHEEYKSLGYRDGDNYVASLVVIRKRPPSGIKISTPFGLCEIANCQETEKGEFQTVFFVTKKQVEKMIKRINQNEP